MLHSASYSGPARRDSKKCLTSRELSLYSRASHRDKRIFGNVNSVILATAKRPLGVHLPMASLPSQSMNCGVQRACEDTTTVR